MCVDNPMCIPAAIERHYRDTGEPFDGYYSKCSFCQKDIPPLEMDMELDDVCINCVAEVMKKVRDILGQNLYHAEFDLYNRVIEKYSDGDL